MPDNDAHGHRQRLRQRFLTEAAGSRSDEALLELLLTFAIPQRDVNPLARQLLAKYGSLGAVLAAHPSTLLSEAGLGPNSVVLLKLVDWLSNHSAPEGEISVSSSSCPPASQDPLFDLQALTHASGAQGAREAQPTPGPMPGARRTPAQPRPRAGTGLFSNALLREAIELLPELPDTTSLAEVKAYLVGRLHYSAFSTRQRYAEYIARRMFPSGQADRALRAFARHFAGRQELRDACFYRFCVSEPLMLRVIDEALLPGVSRGQIARSELREYLAVHFPGRDTRDALKAMLDALLATGWVRGDRSLLSYGYHEVLPASLAFVLHSEFPEPGMYAIDALAGCPGARALFWDPQGIASALYELRNKGLLAKVSEIDDARQFTVRYTLDEVVDQLGRAGMR